MYGSIYHKGCAKKMRSPKIIGTILTPLEWFYSFHIKTKTILDIINILYIYIKTLGTL